MARGWESKSVESQQDDRAARRSKGQPDLAPEAREREQKRRALQLSRARIVDELARSRSDAHRASLERALAFLDEEERRLN